MVYIYLVIYLSTDESSNWKTYIFPIPTGSSNTLIGMKTPNIHILASLILFFSQRNQSSLENDWFQVDFQMTQMTTLGASTGQIKYNLGIKINNDSKSQSIK